MAGKTNTPTNKLLRGGAKAKSPLKQLIKNGSLDVVEAAESAGDLVNYPIEVEQFRHLQRQAKHSGVDVRTEKLKKEQGERDAYNNGLLSTKDDSLYAKVTPPSGSIIIKLFKKPIFELDGFLKPDLIKTESKSGAGVEYVENRFPYLDAGVVINHSGLDKQFNLPDGKVFEGAIATLKINTRIDKFVYFIDKTDITPTYFDGYITIPAYELETILAFTGDAHYDEAANKCVGKIGNAQLQEKLNNDKENEKGDESKSTSEL